MSDFFNEYRISLGERSDAPFLRRNGTFQDGTTPMFRDTDGTLWAMSGHSHLGNIAVYRGTCLDDMVKVWDIALNFCVGHADYAFSGIRYPEGIRARGSIWPFGLTICPRTHRFFCLFHNETGWNGRGTAYDSFGLCEKPKGDSDFRHIGLMHSDDEGKTWTFDRWVLTAESPCFTERYRADAGNATGQPAGTVSLGSGDFSLLSLPDSEYHYLFYTIIRFDMEKIMWRSCDVYVARCRKREDGLFGDFVKYYDGSFCEAGNLGRETAIAHNSWHPRVTYSEKYHVYLMSSTLVIPGDVALVSDRMEVRSSPDLIHWSRPFDVLNDDGTLFGNHYLAMVSEGETDAPSVLPADEFSILSNHNGTDVQRIRARFVPREDAEK